jgi:cystathionine beta-synthase
MIAAAEKDGSLKPGGTLVEATAGNTGIGLALVALMKGYKIILVIPDKMSQEKINHLRSLGAEIIFTRSDVAKGHPQYYQDLAQKIAKENGAFYVNQFENPANPLSHETTTGPEIWEQMQHDVDTVVIGVGSSGTITGLTHFFKKVSSKTEMVLADPEGSVLAEYINTGLITKEAGSWLVEGIGEDFVPSIADFSLTKKAYTISDRESFETVHELLKKEGLLAGSSTGTLLSAALKYCREQTSPKRVVTFACDSGNKYLSKMYNEAWMFDQGLKKRKMYGDLRDIIARRFEDNATVFVSPGDTLNTAYCRMKAYDISQIPVLDDKKIVGIVDESDLLTAIYSKDYDFNSVAIDKIMTTKLKKIYPNETVDKLISDLNKGFVAIIEDKDKIFHGIITKIDLINYLRNGKY